MNHPNITRRRLMQMSAGTLLVSGLWPGALRGQDAASQDFSFIQVNDVHYIDDRAIPFFKDAIQKMKQALPDARLALMVGDTCEHGTPAELNGMKDILKTLGMEVRTVMGNHDWTTQTDRAAYEQTWPNSINYTFDHGGWQFVGLDTSDGVKWQNTAVSKATLDWVDQNLPRLDKRRPMILFTHFPLGEGVRYGVTNGADLLNRFKEYNLKAVYNGHFHGFTERDNGAFAITTDRCCSFHRDNHDGTREKGFFACRVKDGKLTRQFVEVSKELAPKG
jgi:hypothetical protein